jgi:hypothetical protein
MPAVTPLYNSMSGKHCRKMVNGEWSIVAKIKNCSGKTGKYPYCLIW